jgi:hypothetical protein
MAFEGWADESLVPVGSLNLEVVAHSDIAANPTVYGQDDGWSAIEYRVFSGDHQFSGGDDGDHINRAGPPTDRV